MKNVVANLQRSLERVNKEILHREEYVKKLSEKWNASDKGITYVEGTGKLKTCSEFLVSSIEDLKEVA
jgi:hypothetical protein